MSDDNKKFWDKVSRFYKLIQEKGNKKLYIEIAKECRPYVKNKDLLELACGSGQVSYYLNEEVKTYIATDYSSKMIKEANKRHIDNVSFKEMDATSLPYLDNSFDVILIANALHIMPNPSLALKEIYRVLKPDGILLAPTFVYDKPKKSVKLWVSKKFGFKTYHNWIGDELIAFIESFGFKTLQNSIINGNPLDVEFIVSEKK